MSETADEFRDRQKAEALEQNQKADNAVPEQRPIASQRKDGDEIHGQQYPKLRDAGVLNEEPMPKSAYEKAEKGTGSGSSKERQENLQVGTRITITEGPWENTPAAIIRVKRTPEGEIQYKVGNEESRFAEVESYIARTRDGRSDLVELAPDEFVVVPAEDFRRGVT